MAAALVAFLSIITLDAVWIDLWNHDEMASEWCWRGNKSTHPMLLCYEHVARESRLVHREVQWDDGPIVRPITRTIHPVHNLSISKFNFGTKSEFPMENELRSDLNAHRIQLALIYPVPLPRDDMMYSQKVFQSLAMITRNLESSSPYFIESKAFIVECAGSGQCSVIQLCNAFRYRFMCNAHGQLCRMNYRDSQLKGHFNLSLLPNTVTGLCLKENKLNNIGSLSDLKGTSLRYLDLSRNQNLVIDLSALENQQQPLPLEGLCVSKQQVTHYLGLSEHHHSGNIQQWMQISTLITLIVRYKRTNRSKSKCFKIQFHKNGTTEYKRSYRSRMDRIDCWH